ncbi:SET domain-containing protein [Coniophora puteana RWD-64-598 SS2]|uniref:Ribosomal lysine N-methyltransferase 4 n=1 Tax=Coniophora puteana (strain RWD-64-598) TaxID=741705 RepID=A0A5M3MW48_CONPW|nr:SET domain-containing protein [Coniophora puteana RWD-64-598 SS2]EIW83379.1 SET domain-containing protein [Coniophora puteana RWD-64-598 SS2]
MSVPTPVLLLAPFASWFESHGGVVASHLMDVAELPGHGRGAFALQDIHEGTTLFSLPRELTLSLRTSTLPSLLGVDRWKEFGLNKGWVGLILCMMWEESRGVESKWDVYLSSLPSTFDTPMFWSAEDLEELKGTAVPDKIGRNDAEKDYREKLVPAVQSRPDLFPLDTLDRFYSVERYHIMGSRILSRSFHVEKWEGGPEDEEMGDVNGEPQAENGSAPSGEAVPPTEEAASGDDGEGPGDGEGADEEDNEEDAEDPADVAMVPMADLLNARYGSSNAKLFYEEHALEMRTTRFIRRGDQIWNTYGDPPNSDLLRRYGHVDLVPLAQGGLGNPADVVEVRADLVTDVVSASGSSIPVAERIDWYLEMGGDDVFVLETDLDIPEPLIVLVRLLQLLEPDWEKTREKEKPPKPKMDGAVIGVLVEVLHRRLKEYPTTIDEDEALLYKEDTLSINKKNAIIVRMGEKIILQRTLESLQRLASQSVGAGKDGKKKRSGTGDAEGFKAKRART